MNKLNSIVDSMREDIIRTTQEMIRIRSVKEAPMGDMPFGEGIQKCLDYTVNLCETMGFKTENIDNYALHADLGQGTETLGILAHIDVVPEGDNWDYDPYGAVIADGRIYGRGAIDDKGPAVAALYAMKALKETGAPMKKKVRIIFGTDEESGWECMDHYFAKMPAPDFGFTPDADFPAIHGEKGILIFDLVKPLPKPYTGEGIRLVSINGGNRPNMVPDSCEAFLADTVDLSDAAEAYALEADVKVETFTEANGARIKVHGVSAHGSLPEKGVNAISHMMLFLGRLPLASGDMRDLVSTYCHRIGLEYYGEHIGCGFEDADSGKLIFNVGMIKGTETEVNVTVNIRYPITNSDETVYTGIRDALAGTGIDIEHHEHKKPIYFPKDHPLIETLMGVYREQTGDMESQPITIGGGTYARAMDNCVAFGPLMPGMPELAHQKNEFIGVEHLIQMTKIYAHALYKLTVE